MDYFTKVKPIPFEIAFLSSKYEWIPYRKTHKKVENQFCFKELFPNSSTTAEA